MSSVAFLFVMEGILLTVFLTVLVVVAVDAKRRLLFHTASLCVLTGTMLAACAR